MNDVNVYSLTEDDRKRMNILSLPGSLREAIQAANTDLAVDACPAGGAADTMMVPAGVYLLTLAGAGEDGNATGDLDVGQAGTAIAIDGALKSLGSSTAIPLPVQNEVGSWVPHRKPSQT